MQLHAALSWHIVYTRPGCEKKVESRLRRKGLPAWCPMNRHTGEGWQKEEETPLFPSWVFVRISADEISAVWNTAGVISFVYWLQRPAIIREEEIQTIKKFLQDYEEIRPERIDVQMNDVGQVLQNPLMNRESLVMEVHAKTVKVVIPSLGYSLIAKVELINVEVLKKTTAAHDALSNQLHRYKCI